MILVFSFHVLADRAYPAPFPLTAKFTLTIVHVGKVPPVKSMMDTILQADRLLQLLHPEVACLSS